MAGPAECSANSDCCGGNYANPLVVCDYDPVSDVGTCCFPPGHWCNNPNQSDATCCSGYCDSAYQCT